MILSSKHSTTVMIYGASSIQKPPEFAQGASNLKIYHRKLWTLVAHHLDDKQPAVQEDSIKEELRIDTEEANID